MIRVLHIIDTGGPGGAETVFLQTATRLDPASFQSTAVVGSQGWLAGQFEKSTAPPQIVSARGSFNFRYLRAIVRLALQSRSDVIVAHLYGSAVYASLAGMICSLPVISVLHGQSDVARTGRLATLKANIVRRGSDRAIFVSPQLREHLQPRFGLSNAQCVVIPNGVDTEVFRPTFDRSLRNELRLADETILVGAIGNVRAPKGYEVLLQAVRILRLRSQHFHFVIAGDSDNTLGQELKGLAAELGVESHVTFLGLRSDVARILNNLDLFVLSSHTEGFSIACIEAMACGVPVIATRSGGPEEILQDGAGVLVPTGQPDSLALAIEQVSAAKSLGISSSAKAMQRVHERYSLKMMLSRYEDLLRQVVKNCQRARKTVGALP